MDSDDKPNAPVPLTTIHDIPVEILFQILKRIPEDSPHSLDNAQNVCSLWFAIINEWLGRIVTTSSRLVIDPSNPDLTGEGLGLISEIGVRILHIEEENYNLLENPPSPLPSYKWPHLMRALGVESQIHPDLFRSLISGTVNLSVFWVCLSALENLTEELKHLKFPKLKQLIVEETTRNRRNDVLALPSLRMLLKENNFPRLTILVIRFPVETFQDVETAKFLIPFIHRHQALRELSVKMYLSWENLQPDQVTPYEEDLKSIIADIDNHECCPSLKILEVTSTNLQLSHPQYEIWKRFLAKTNCSPEKMELNIGPISNDLLEKICSRNGSALKELVVDPQYSIRTQEKLDLRIFSSLSCLRKLRITANREITGARYLPQTLEIISLGGWMQADDVNHILLQMPNLIRIELNIEFNDQPGYGFRSETLQQFVQARKVNSLHLHWSGATDQFPEEGIPNGDPVKPLMLSHSYNSVYWMLNKDGYYFTNIICTVINQ